MKGYEQFFALKLVVLVKIGPRSREGNPLEMEWRSCHIKSGIIVSNDGRLLFLIRQCIR